MSVELFLGLTGLMITLFGCTWHLSGRLEAIKMTTQYTKETLVNHIDDTEKKIATHDRRFDEVFSQQRELANQLFWLDKNVKTPQGRKSSSNLQDAESFA